MPSWDERFTAHPVHKTVQDFKAVIDSGAVSISNKDQLVIYQRVCHVLEHIRGALTVMDPMLVNFQVLDNLNGFVATILRHLNAYITSKDSGNIAVASSHADNALGQLRGLVTSNAPSDMQAVREAATDFRNSLTQLLAETQREAVKLRDEAGKGTEKLAEAQRRVDQLAQIIESHKTRLDQVIAEFQRQFSQSEDRRRKEGGDLAEQLKKEFTDSISKVRAGSEELIQSGTKRLKEWHEKVSQEATERIKALEAKRVEAAKLVNVIGNIGVTGNFQRIADAERKSANAWRWIALVLMLGMIANAGTVVYLVAGHGFDLGAFALRLFTTVTIAIPAFYAARESAKHRRAEQVNRKQELELASIDPFLERMPTEKQQELKAKLTDKLFGQPIEEEKPEKTASVSMLVDLLKAAMNALQRK